MPRLSLPAGALLSGLFAWHAPAAAQSFDCARAASPTEKAICADPGLGVLDEALAKAYRRAVAAGRGAAAAAGESAVRTDQRRWIGRRDACKADTACLTTSLERRQTVLDLLEIAFTRASRRLEDGTRPATLAWQAWLRGNLGVTVGAGASYRDAAEATVDSYIRDIAQGSPEAPAGDLDVLRLASDDADEALPCGLLHWHGPSALDAFGPFYGSARDGAAPTSPWICLPEGGLPVAEAWEPVEAQFEKAIMASAPRLGTIRHSQAAAVALAGLKLLHFPDLLVEAAGEFAEARAFIEGWGNPRWLDEAGKARTLALVDRAVGTWAATLRPALGPHAEAGARGYAAAHLGWLSDSLAGVTADADTRLPPAMLGRWQAAGGPVLRIDGDSLCLATRDAEDCNLYERDLGGPGEDFAARLAAAKVATTGPLVEVWAGTALDLALTRDGGLALMEAYEPKAAPVVFRRIR